MKKSVLFFCLLSVFSVNMAAQKVIVQVSGIKETTGNVLVGVYNDAAAFAKVGSEIKLMSVPAHSETVDVEIPGLKDGEYAFTVLHDKNGDGKCDFNLLGIPKESFGFSNNVKPKLKTPSYHDVKVNVADGMIIRIKLLTF